MEDQNMQSDDEVIAEFDVCFGGLLTQNLHLL